MNGLLTYTDTALDCLIRNIISAQRNRPADAPLAYNRAEGVTTMKNLFAAVAVVSLLASVSGATATGGALRQSIVRPDKAPQYAPIHEWEEQGYHGPFQYGGGS